MNRAAILQCCNETLMGPALLKCCPAWQSCCCLAGQVCPYKLVDNGLMVQSCQMQRASEASGELIFAKPDHVGVQAFRPCAILEASPGTA